MAENSVRLSIGWVLITLTFPANYTGIIPMYCRKCRKANTYECSIRYLPEVLAAYRNIHSAEEITIERIRSIYEMELLRRAMPESIKTAPVKAENSTLWEHQIRGVHIATYNSRYAFFYDTRTGKTRMAYRIMENALELGRTKRCIVLVPSSIIPDWLSDAEAFLLPKFKVAAFYKDDKTRQAAIEANADILIVSTEQVVKHYSELPKDFNLCFFDESSKLKSHKTQISEFMRAFSKTVQFLYLLSATPAPNGYHEYYTQMMCLDPCIFSDSITRFKNEYFIDYSHSNKYEMLKIRSDKKEEFENLIESYAYYVDQKVMPMAKKEFIEVKYQLPQSARAIYEQMRENMFVELQGKKLTANMATLVRQKLQQITSGFYIDSEAKVDNMVIKKLGLDDEQKKVIYNVHAAKRARLKCLDKIMYECRRDNQHEKFIIWANYREEFSDLTQFMTEHNIVCATLNGTTTQSYKEKIIDEFKRGNIQVLLCHPLSVGMGKNFTESHIAIYYSVNDSWEAFKQSSERIAGHITVQPKDCQYYIIMAEDTIDEIVYRNVRNKRDQSFDLLNHLSGDGKYDYNN